MFQLAKDVVGHEVINVYVEHKVYTLHEIVDLSELENTIDDDVKCIGVNVPNDKVSNDQSEVNEPNCEDGNDQPEVSEPNCEDGND